MQVFKRAPSDPDILARVHRSSSAMLTQRTQTVRADALPTAPHRSSAGDAREKASSSYIESHPCRNSTGTTPSSSPVFPAIVYQGSHFVRPNKCPADCVALDLKTPRLNVIHHHLWLACLPNAPRPLHKQRLLGRSIFVTEDPDEHLVWFEAQIFVKPLPEYLLEYDYWDKHL